MTLFDIYTLILGDSNKWKYYNYLPTPSIEELFMNNGTAESFVKEYFAGGDKLGVFNQGSLGLDNRWIHTVSVYLLGIYLADALSINLYTEDARGDKKRLYMWYLTCLYHDYGYTIENAPIKFPPKGLTIHQLFEKCNGRNYYRSRNGEFSDMVRLRYYNYFRNEYHKINHGIIGGLLLYDQLLNHFNRKLNGNKEYIDEFNNLYYSTNQKENFAQCANAIIAHNMWFNKFPIKELTLNDGQKYTYKDWLTALLVLCDTIEPLKNFPCCVPLYVLKMIQLEKYGDTIKIAVDSNHCLPNRYLHKCQSLEDWTNVSINLHTNQLEIKEIRKLYMQE